MLSELKSISSDVKFWTSASSENCPREFGWCGSGELMDYEELNISRERMDASKTCLIANLNYLTSTLSLVEDECLNSRARAICESPNHYMCKRSECWKFKCPKELSYYQGAKGSCGFDFRLISFETLSKLNCVEDLFKSSKKIPNGQFWVGGVSFGCYWDNRWCNGDDEPPIANNDRFPWKADEPSNVSSKECIAVDFSMNKQPHFTFFKADCNTKMKTITESIAKA